MSEPLNPKLSGVRSFLFCRIFVFFSTVYVMGLVLGLHVEVLLKISFRRGRGIIILALSRPPKPF